MIEDAASLSRLDLTELSDHHLAEEIRRRKEIYDRWVETYNNEFIPFAHGMRLFGQFYNDTVRPQDPYEFMDLLGSKRLASLERNRMLDEMASMIQGNISLAEYLRNSEGIRRRNVQSLARHLHRNIRRPVLFGRGRELLLPREGGYHKASSRNGCPSALRRKRRVPGTPKP